MTTMRLPFQGNYVAPDDNPYGLAFDTFSWSCDLHGEFACTSKACAPPPVGAGGSLPSGRSSSKGTRVRSKRSTEFGKSVRKMISSDTRLAPLKRSNLDPLMVLRNAADESKDQLRKALSDPKANRELLDKVVRIQTQSGNPVPPEVKEKILDLFSPEMLRPDYLPVFNSDEEGLYLAVREVLHAGRYSYNALLFPDLNLGTVHVTVGLDTNDLARVLSAQNRLASITPEVMGTVVGIGSLVRSEIMTRLKSHPLRQPGGFEREQQRFEESLGKIGEEFAAKFPDVILNPESMIIEEGRVVSWGGAYRSPNQLSVQQRDAMDAFVFDRARAYGLRDLSSAVRHINSVLGAADTEAIIGSMAEVRSFGGKPKAMGTDAKMLAHTLAEGAAALPSAWIDMSNGRSDKMTALYASTRAQYSFSRVEITLDGSTATSRHELVHRMEHVVPGLVQLERQFFNMRVGGTPVLKPLNELVQTDRYRADEVADPDKFWNPYCGKSYDGRAFEIMSMGVENLVPHLKIRASMDEGIAHTVMDDQYLDFVIGTLTTLQWEE